MPSRWSWSRVTVAKISRIRPVGPTAAAVIIAEVGTDMTRFPTPAHLASWARFAPGVKEESARRKKGTGATGHGNRYLARVLGEAAVSVGRTDTFLGGRYRRIARRLGKKKAVVAVGRSILVIVWHLLGHDNAHFRDLGSDCYDSCISPGRKRRSHIRELQALGYKVTPRTRRLTGPGADLTATTPPGPQPRRRAQTCAGTFHFRIGARASFHAWRWTSPQAGGPPSPGPWWPTSEQRTGPLPGPRPGTSGRRWCQWNRRRRR